MTGIHVFVICCAEYEDIVEECIEVFGYKQKFDL